MVEGVTSSTARTRRCGAPPAAHQPLRLAAKGAEPFGTPYHGWQASRGWDDDGLMRGLDEDGLRYGVGPARRDRSPTPGR